jgi:hypothetical protein
MDTKLTVVGDSEFEMLAQTGDYKGCGTGNSLTRVADDVFYIVLRQSEYDRLQRSIAEVEAECADEAPAVSYSQFDREASGLN